MVAVDSTLQAAWVAQSLQLEREDSLVAMKPAANFLQLEHHVTKIATFVRGEGQSK
jgi:hypothetical protein